MNAKTTLAYRRSVELLRQLDRLMANGHDESDEADEIRAEMERPWYEMTEAEQLRFRFLSADLYTLWEPVPERPPPDFSTRSRFEDAERACDWETVLSVLRAHPNIVSPSRAALLRAKGWQSLGEKEISSEFFDLHVRLEQEAASKAKLESSAHRLHLLNSCTSRRMLRDFPSVQHIEMGY